MTYTITNYNCTKYSKKWNYNVIFCPDHLLKEFARNTRLIPPHPQMRRTAQLPYIQIYVRLQFIKRKDPTQLVIDFMK